MWGELSLISRENKELDKCASLALRNGYWIPKGTESQPHKRTDSNHSRKSASNFCYYFFARLKCQPSNSNYLSTLTRAQTLMGPKGQYCNRASEPHVGNLAVLKAGFKSKSDTMCSLYKTTTSITKSANSYSVVKEQRNHRAKASDITMYSCGKGKVNFNILNACYASIIHYQRIKTTTQHQAVTVI